VSDRSQTEALLPTLYCEAVRNSIALHVTWGSNQKSGEGDRPQLQRIAGITGATVWHGRDVLILNPVQSRSRKWRASLGGHEAPKPQARATQPTVMVVYDRSPCARSPAGSRAQGYLVITGARRVEAMEKLRIVPT